MNGSAIVLVTAVTAVAPTVPAVGIPCNGGQAPICTFRNDRAGYLLGLATIGVPERVIDFETLPDGSPSHGGVQITPTFNYTAQGATFTSPNTTPYIAGFSTGPFDLQAFTGSPAIRTWITAELTTPSRAVGIFFPGGTTLSAYGHEGQLLGSVSYTSSGNGFFLGIISDVAITRAIINRNSDGEDISDFVYSPVPEPTTLVLLACGIVILRRTRRHI